MWSANRVYHGYTGLHNIRVIRFKRLRRQKPSTKSTCVPLVVMTDPHKVTYSRQPACHCPSERSFLHVHWEGSDIAFNGPVICPSGTPSVEVYHWRSFGSFRSLAGIAHFCEPRIRPLNASTVPGLRDPTALIVEPSLSERKWRGSGFDGSSRPHSFHDQGSRLSSIEGVGVKGVVTKMARLNLPRVKQASTFL